LGEGRGRRGRWCAGAQAHRGWHTRSWQQEYQSMVLALQLHVHATCAHAYQHSDMGPCIAGTQCSFRAQVLWWVGGCSRCDAEAREMPLTDKCDQEDSRPDGNALNPLPFCTLLWDGSTQDGGQLQGTRQGVACQGEVVLLKLITHHPLPFTPRGSQRGCPC
jgi:hypothetical protein